MVATSFLRPKFKQPGLALRTHMKEIKENKKKKATNKKHLKYI